MSPQERAEAIRSEFSEFENLSSVELNACCIITVNEILDAIGNYDMVNSEKLAKTLLYWYDVKKQFT